MTTLDIDVIARAIRETQNRIKDADANPVCSRCHAAALRGVRRTAAHIAEQLDNKSAINFLIACGYGASND